MNIYTCLSEIIEMCLIQEDQYQYIIRAIVKATQTITLSLLALVRLRVNVHTISFPNRTSVPLIIRSRGTSCLLELKVAEPEFKSADKKFVMKSKADLLYHGLLLNILLMHPMNLYLLNQDTI